MLCSVLADKTARPPLSVGLFGEWGSGKSFFMRLMRQRIEKLAGAAYQAEADGREAQYCASVVQITFNAWHYMDANLWASLAVEIFSRLATPVPPGTAAPTTLEAERARVAEERARILQKLDTYQRLVSELTEIRERIEQERERVARELDEATRSREDIARRLAAVVAGNVAEELDDDEELTGLRTEAARLLGMAEIPSPELPGLVGDLRKLSGQASAVWRLLAKRRGTWTFWLAAAFVVALLAGLVLLASPGRLVPGAASIAAALAAMSGVAARTRPVLKTVSDGLDVAESALRRAETLEQQFRAQQTKEQIELEAELKGLAAKEHNLAIQLTEVRAREAEARAEERDLRAGRRLNLFLQEREGSSDYRSHLGLISRLHQDLQQLSTLLELAKEDQEGAAESNQLPRIDRIILYVDDLDRCPPARVVEVLQAIHLLLALPLFVVVVGVDPRWLLRSLQRHYRTMLVAPQGEEGGWADVSHWASTPQNYLEKIFQIPFALMPMSGVGFARLVSDLASQDTRIPGASGLVGAGQTDNEAVGAPSREKHRIRVQEGSVASQDEDIDPNPSGLSLSDREVRFIQALAPMITTPRAGKRLVNIYRMIRSTQATGGASAFLDLGPADDGDYRAVLVLLAIVSGFPRLAGPAFAMLLAAEPDTTWAEFVDGLAVSGPQVGVKFSSHLRRSDAADWSRLQTSVLTVQETVNVPEKLRPYREWAPRVARFSFDAGRLIG